MTSIIFWVVWLTFGYFWTRWFVNSFLDNGRWGDTGERPGIFALAMMTFFGGAMALIMLALLAHERYDQRDRRNPNIIQRLYGVKR